ncbi:MAG: enterochelin esterase [Thermoanaerobaculia bacterium]|nr:enterochelin esterase [Thermoanaerobaculia bacterium]MBP9826544.1 enterochelin esterase [Thermoanaerobaculia bacterium]
MTLAISRLLAEGELPPARIDAFLAAHTVPIVEGRTVTFLYRGDADAVFLQHWIFGLPSAQPFAQILGTDLWYLTQEIPVRSRVEYKLEVQRGDVSRLIRDPLNSQLAHDPFGANSVCQGADYRIPDWISPDPEARPGKLESLRVPSVVLGGPQELQVYLPARFRTTRRYPLLIVHDGSDYLHFSVLKTVLDNLIHRLEVAPMIVALTQSRQRLRDYAAQADHSRYLAEELVPALEARYPLQKGPASRGLMGASFGGVAALAAAAHYPGQFGRLLLQSGSFAFTDIGPSRRGPAFEPVVEFVNRFRDAPKRISERVFVSCGVYESLIYENRSLVPILQSTGMDVHYVESFDGHNWENWRDRLREGLFFLFPGPLWMVYE